MEPCQANHSAPVAVLSFIKNEEDRPPSSAKIDFTIMTRTNGNNMLQRHFTQFVVIFAILAWRKCTPFRTCQSNLFRCFFSLSRTHRRLSYRRHCGSNTARQHVSTAVPMEATSVKIDTLWQKKAQNVNNVRLTQFILPATVHVSSVCCMELGRAARVPTICITCISHTLHINVPTMLTAENERKASERRIWARVSASENKSSSSTISTIPHVYLNKLMPN